MKEEQARHNFSIRLRQLREGNGLGARELSRELGLNSESLVYHYEIGRQTPRLGTLLKICDYFSVTPDELFGYKPLRKL